MTEETTAVAEAVRREVETHRMGLQALRDEAEAAEPLALKGIEDGEVNNDGGRWTACAVGPCAMHLRHPLALESACGYPEWTNFVSGFVGALDYVWVDTGDGDDRGDRGGGLRPIGCMPLPPLEAVVAEVALPNAQFPSDHLPMVADLEFV